MTWVTHVHQGLEKANYWDVNRRADTVKRKNKKLPCSLGGPSNVFRWIFLCVSPGKAHTLNFSGVAHAEMCLDHGAGVSN